MLTAEVSAKAYSGRWQLAQLMVLSLESTGSKNNNFPSAALLAGSTAGPVVSTKDCITVNNAAASIANAYFFMALI